MNFLFQAYACAADKGGEYAISYGWLEHLDTMVDSEDVIYVVSLTFTSEDLRKSGFKHVRILDIPGMKKYEFLHYNYLYYKIWQKKAYLEAINSGIKFDFVHVFSLSDFRSPGNWYRMQEAYRVLGPVGGGQKCPKALWDYDDKSGQLRNIVNKVCEISPWFKAKVSRYSLVYACNYETLRYLPGSHLLVDVPLNDKFANQKIDRSENELVTLICAGRLINKKGFLFLLDCLSNVRAKSEWHVYIYGDGPQRDIIYKKIIENGLDSRVFLKGNVSYEKIGEAYKSGDIFIMPSLRESGGSVLVEAMAYKLPIVSLKLGLSKILDERKAGLFVNTEQNKKSIISEFANNIERLIDDPTLRRNLGCNGYNYVNSELTWNNMIKEIYGAHVKGLAEK